MTHREVATLACRVLAIWAVIDALGQLGEVVRSMHDLYRVYSMSGTVLGAETILWRLGSLFPTMVQFAVAVWLWKRAGVVAAWMTGDDLQDEPTEREPGPRHRATIEQVQAVVLSSLGVYVLVDVLPRLGSVAFQFLLAWIIANGKFDAGAHVVTNQVFIWSFQLLLGVWLIFGAKGMGSMLKRARRDH